MYLFGIFVDLYNLFITFSNDYILYNNLFFIDLFLRFNCKHCVSFIFHQSYISNIFINLIRFNYLSSRATLNINAIHYIFFIFVFKLNLLILKFFTPIIFLLND